MKLNKSFLVLTPKGKSKIGKRNPMWKGRYVGYAGIHAWIKRRLKKPKKCERCKENKNLDLANKSQHYFRLLNDWEWLCRKCHMQKDGRMKNLVKRNKITKGHGIVTCALCHKKKEYEALGMCNPCYQRWKLIQHPERRAIYQARFKAKKYATNKETS